MSLLSKLKQVNAKPPPEEHIGLRVAVLVAVLAASLAVLAQGVGGPGLRFGVVVGIPAAFWFSWWARHREGFWVKVALAVAVMVAFASFLDSALSVQGGNFANLQIPLAQLFLWVQLVHAFDVPARRDLLFSLVSSLILVGVAGALSISMDLVPFLVVWAASSITALVLSHRSELADLPGLTGSGPTARSIVDVSMRIRQTAPVVVCCALIVVVGAAAFRLAPPAGQARAITFPSYLPGAVSLPDQGGLSNPALGDGDPAGPVSAPVRAGNRGGKGRASFAYPGFSTSLDTGVRGRPDRTLVMRVRANRPDLWRGQTFDAWDGETWTVSGDRPAAIGAQGVIPVPPALGDPEVIPDATELVQTYYVQTPGPNLIFGAAAPTKLYFPDRRVFQLPDGTLRAGVPLGKDAVYTVVSSRAAVTADRLRASDLAADGTIAARALPADVAARYATPAVTTQRVRELAASITAEAPTTYDKVLAIESWLSSNTRYTLNIPPLPDGADAVDQFLFVDKRGFCEQIGTSLVVMLRSIGLPARLVTGYAPGERNPFTGLYEVRGKDAHAWAEVWFPGLGWQGFDPTAVVPLAGDAGADSASSGVASYLSHRLPHPPLWAVIGLGVLALMAVAVVAGSRAIRVVLRFVRRPSPSWPDECLARLERIGASRGRPRRQSETVREYAAALRRGPVSDPRLEHVADIVTGDAFGSRRAASEDRELVERVLAELNSG